MFTKIFFFSFFLSLPFYLLGSQDNWAVYYHDDLDPQSCEGYHLLVLDSKYHPPLQPLKEKDRILLGYISLGEVESHRKHYSQVQHLLGQENPHWPGSYYVDVRNPEWSKLVIEELIPEILLKGFDGIFMDTLDNPIYQEEEHPETFKGMTQAAAHLIQTIRMHYPKIKIMMNRAYALLPQVGKEIDMVLGECVYADYNFETKTYQKVEKDQYQQQVQWLKEAKKTFPQLKIYTLDYWSPQDKKGLKEIYQVQKEHGFLPYVATIELDTLIPEPSP